MDEDQYTLITSKGTYKVDRKSRIVIYTSTIIKDLIITTNYPKDWGLNRIFQHIIDHNLKQGII